MLSGDFARHDASIGFNVETESRCFRSGGDLEKSDEGRRLRSPMEFNRSLAALKSLRPSGRGACGN